MPLDAADMHLPTPQEMVRRGFDLKLSTYNASYVNPLTSGWSRHRRWTACRCTPKPGRPRSGRRAWRRTGFGRCAPRATPSSARSSSNSPRPGSVTSARPRAATSSCSTAAFRLLRTIKSAVRYFEAAQLADDRARAVQGISSHRPRRRHGGRGHHAADGGRRRGGRPRRRLPEIHARWAIAAWRWAWPTTLSRRRGHGQAGRRQRPHHPVRPDRDPPRGRQRRRHRRHRGVDCLWVGHFDLSSRSASRASSAPDLPRRDRTVAKACRKNGKACGRLVPDVAAGLDYWSRGFDFLCYSGDVWLLGAAIKAGSTGCVTAAPAPPRARPTARRPRRRGKKKR